MYSFSRWHKFLLAGLLTAALCWTAGCRKQDLRTVTIQVPALKNQECARIIQDAFIRHPGIKTVQPDVAARTVRVTYNSMVIARKNLEFIIANAGFDANDDPANTNAAASLPDAAR